MTKQELIPFFRTEYIQDKILAEQALNEAEIEFQIDAPKHMKGNSLFQESGPWEFYTTNVRLSEAEEIVRTLPCDNLLITPQDAPETTSAQKTWAWMLILIAAVMTAMIAYMLYKL